MAEGFQQLKGASERKLEPNLFCSPPQKGAKNGEKMIKIEKNPRKI
jgi:hypothetical protein